MKAHFATNAEVQRWGGRMDCIQNLQKTTVERGPDDGCWSISYNGDKRLTFNVWDPKNDDLSSITFPPLLGSTDQNDQGIKLNGLKLCGCSLRIVKTSVQLAADKNAWLVEYTVDYFANIKTFKFETNDFSKIKFPSGLWCKECEYNPCYSEEEIDDGWDDRGASSLFY